MNLEIVTHCWAKDLPQYATFLKYHLTSLMDQDVVVTVCYSHTDDRTCEVLTSFFQKRCESDSSQNASFIDIGISELGRRAIGRNIAAKQSTADWIWFCDVDHVFGKNCLSNLSNQLSSLDNDVVMVYPKQIMIHKTHALGDQLVAEDNGEMIKKLPPADDFEPKKYNRAIGGVQIVRGDLVRRIGYCPSKKWQTPITDGTVFDTREDIAFRNLVKLHGTIKGIDVPNLYRLRHSKCAYK